MAEINLLPAQYRQQQWRRKLRPLCGFGSVLVAGLLVFWLASLVNGLNVYRQEVIGIEEELADLQPLLAELRELEEQKEQLYYRRTLLATLDKGRFPWQKFLVVLEGVVPAQVEVGGISIDSAGHVIISGRGDGLTRIALFLENLGGLEHLEGVELGELRQDPGGAWVFEILGQVASNREEQ